MCFERAFPYDFKSINYFRQNKINIIYIFRVIFKYLVIISFPLPSTLAF